MRLRHKREILFLLGLLAVGAVGFGGFYFLASRFASSDSWWRSRPRDRTALSAAGSPAEPGDHLVLRRDRLLDFEDLRLRFRGIDASRTILIDVIQPAMDPDVGYPYRLQPPEAERGFPMAGRKFRLLSFGPDQIRLRVLPPE